MGVLRNIAARLLAWSTYQALPEHALGPEIDSPDIERARQQHGGQLAPLNVSQTRWYLADLEVAERAADCGDMQQPARLMHAARKDGVFSGVLSTSTDGLVRLPKRFRGNAEVIKALEVGHDQVTSVFDEMFPPTELALLAGDGRGLGVGVGELVPVDGRDYPVFVRLEPAFLHYRWSENRWYYRSAFGLLPITPGDGRWILHTPGGRMSPWRGGIWRAIGRAFIRKEHAQLHKDNWEAKLANPARVAVAPTGAAEAQVQSWFRKVMAWGVNTVFGLRPGWDVKLIESNGRGFVSFDTTIKQQNEEMIIAVAGQTVTTDGGAGFQNSDIHKTIRADLIKAIADGLAYTLNTQGLPAFIAARWGVDALHTHATVIEWDVTPPKDRNSEASSMLTAGNAIKVLREALAAAGRELDVTALCTKLGVPTAGDVASGEVQAPKVAPVLRLVPPLGEGVSPEAAAAAAAPPAQDVQSQALNGAQMAELKQLAIDVRNGLLPRENAIAIARLSFPDASKEEIERAMPEPKPAAEVTPPASSEQVAA